MKVQLNLSKKQVTVLQNHLAEYNELCGTKIRLTGTSINKLVTNMMENLGDDNLFEEHYPE